MLFPLPATLDHKQEEAAIQGFWCFLSLFLGVLSWTHTWRHLSFYARAFVIRKDSSDPHPTEIAPGRNLDDGIECSVVSSQRVLDVLGVFGEKSFCGCIN